jgi:hypothetical protein
VNPPREVHDSENEATTQYAEKHASNRREADGDAEGEMTWNLADYASKHRELDGDVDGKWSRNQPDNISNLNEVNGDVNEEESRTTHRTAGGVLQC